MEKSKPWLLGVSELLFLWETKSLCQYLVTYPLTLPVESFLKSLTKDWTIPGLRKFSEILTSLKSRLLRLLVAYFTKEERIRLTLRPHIPSLEWIWPCLVFFLLRTMFWANILAMISLDGLKYTCNIIGHNLHELLGPQPDFGLNQSMFGILPS